MKNRKVLSWLIAVLCLIPQMLFAQNLSVQGTVTDENGEAMIGVSVLVKGTSTGVITDLDGNFALSASSGSTLVFSYIGYKTLEKKVTGTEMKVSLSPDTEILDEVVVIAYGQQKKVTVTGSFSNVIIKELL